MTPPNRTVFLPAARFPAWWERFTATHGGSFTQEPTDAGVVLRLPDGAQVLVTAPWPNDGRPGRGASELERVLALAAQERHVGLLLVRRGGYAVGVCVAGRLLTSKVGSSSARSRGAEAGAAVVVKASTEAARQFAGHAFEYLGTGGDKPLVEATLATVALRRHAARSRLAPLTVADPNLAVLTKAAADICALRVHITDPPAH